MMYYLYCCNYHDYHNIYVKRRLLFIDEVIIENISTIEKIYETYKNGYNSISESRFILL